MQLNVESPFPAFRNAHIEAYELLATAEDKKRCAGYFEIEREARKQREETAGKVRLCASLFAAPKDPGTPKIEINNWDDTQKLHPSFRDGQKTWADEFLKPIPRWQALMDRCVITVHLEKQLAFMFDKLVGDGFEVVQMAGNSELANPGAMWRFLPFGEPGPCLLVDFDEEGASHAHDGWLARFERFLETNTEGFYRVLAPSGFCCDASYLIYQPLTAGSFGMRTGAVGELVHIRKAMEAWLWYATTNAVQRQWLHVTEGPRPLFNLERPFSYGADEHFLTQYVYNSDIFLRAGVYTRILTAREQGFHPMFVRDVAYTRQGGMKSPVEFDPENPIQL